MSSCMGYSSIGYLLMLVGITQEIVANCKHLIHRKLAALKWSSKCDTFSRQPMNSRAYWGEKAQEDFSSATLANVLISSHQACQKKAQSFAGAIDFQISLLGRCLRDFLWTRMLRKDANEKGLFILFFHIQLSTLVGSRDSHSIAWTK